MFERFSERARRSVVLAQEHARLLGHHYIGSEHLLLGVLEVIEGDQEAAALADTLAAAGITMAAVSVEVGELGQPGSAPTPEHIPFTPEAKKVLELSLRESIERDSIFIGAAHILLAVTRQDDCRGALVLAQLGGPLAALRQRIAESAPGALGTEFALRGSSWPATRRRGDPELRWVIQLRQVLLSVDERLANLERHLGIAAQGEPGRKLPELIGSVEKRLTDLESHFGLAEAAEAAEADEGPAEGGEPPAAP
jgi:ATP-dependent Clp protease ATP-binding subunit ClpA